MPGLLSKKNHGYEAGTVSSSNGNFNSSSSGGSSGMNIGSNTVTA